MYVNGEAFECIEGGADNASLPPPGDNGDGSGSSGNQENNGASTTPEAITTTTAKTFVPTVAGERGIFAAWPKKVLYFITANISKLHSIKL